MEPTQTPPSKLRAAYDYLKSQDVTVPEDYNEFEQGMQEPERLKKLYGYFKDQDVTVPENYDEFATALLADVKKKSGGVDSGNGSPSITSEASAATTPISEADQEFQQVPQAGALGYQLPGAPLPAAEQAADAEQTQISALQGMQQVPGDEYLAAGLPLPSGEELRAKEQARTEAKASVADDGFFASLGKSLYNGLDPKRVGGNLLDYLGDVDEIASPFGALGGSAGFLAGALTDAPVTDNKATDKLSAALLERAQAGDAQLSDAAQQSFFSKPSAASAGNLLGSGVASIIPVAAASALGGPLAGAGVGAALGISGTKDTARNAGIGDKEAAITATILAPIQGALEAIGVHDPGAAKLAIRATIKEALAASGGKLTAQALAGAAKKVIPEMGRRFAAQGLAEGGTELAQGVAEGEGQVLADALRDNPEAPAGQGRYGTTQMDVLRSSAEQAAVGTILGGSLGQLHGTQGGAGVATQDEAAPISETLYDLKRPTGQVELKKLQLLGEPDPATGMVQVRGQDLQGNPVLTKVQAGRLYESQPAPTATATAAPAAVRTVTLPGAGGVDVLVDVDANQQPVRLYTADGTEYPLDALNSNPEYKAEVEKAIAAQPEVAPEPEPIPTPTPEPVADERPPLPDEPGSPASPEPSPAEAASNDAPTPPETRPEPLPAAEPHPDHTKTLTPQEAAKNAALDALDRFNGLNKTEQKSEDGKARRKELIQLAKKAKLTIKDLPTGKAAFNEGRTTRTNEYTATTPAANHVPLEGRPAEARPFIDAVLAGADANPTEIQGLGIKMRGKELSGRELGDAVKDIKAGKNTLRAQLVLDALENAHRKGYMEKSTGTGIATRKFTVPIDDYLNGGEQTTSTERDLTDDELDAIYESDPKAKQAVDDYTFSDGSIDYAKLANDERGLPFLFDVSDETATKLATLARERAQQQPSAIQNDQGSDRPNGSATEPELGGDTRQAGTDAGSTPEGDARVDEPAPTSEPVGEVAGPTEERKAEIRAEIDAASQRIKERRAARRREGRVLSAPIGEIDVEDLKDALTIARGHVQLGVLGIKNLIAKIRESGLDEEAASDAALTPHLRELLTGEPTPALPANEPEGSAERSSMKRLLGDDTQPQAVRDWVKESGLDKYEPQSQADAEQAAENLIKTAGMDSAEAIALGEAASLDGAVRTALRVALQRMLGQQMQLALDRGDTAQADVFLERTKKMTDVLAKRGTDAGREINAYKLLVANTPEAVVYQTQKDVVAQREQEVAKLGKKLPRERKAIEKAKAEALDNALATPAVRAAREKVAGKQQESTKEKRAAIRAERDDLFTQLRALAKQKPGVAYASIVPISPQQAQAAILHVKIFRTYLQEGLTIVSSMVERFKRDAGPTANGFSDQELRKQAAAAKGDHDEAIKQGMAAMGTTLDQIARDFINDPAAVGKTLAEQFVEGAGLDPADAKTYAQAIEQEFAKRITDARQKRLAELDKRAQATPAKRASQTDLDKTRELFNLSPTDDPAILDHLKRVNELPTLTAQDVAELRQLAEDVRKAPPGFQQEQAVEKLMKRQASIKGVKWAEIGSAVWYANVLSGYKTHVVNLTANVVQTGAELGVSTAHSVATGKGRFSTASAKGLARGLARGAREAYSVLTTGRETSRVPGEYEVPSLLENIRFAGGAANPYNYLKLVGRGLRAGDVLFASGLKEMRAYELAVKYALEDAKSSGSPTAQVWAAANEKLYTTTQRIAEARTQATAEGLTGNDYQRRVYEIAEQSRGADIMDEAREYGTRAVFNGDVKGSLGWVSNGIQHITNGIDYKGFKPAKFIVPFTRVITNVANAYLDYTPVGAVRAYKGSHIGGGDLDSALQQVFTREERQKLAIKAVVGASVTIGAYALSHMKDDEGNELLEITGQGTGNYLKDAQLKADGWQPYSIRVPGTKTWVSYAYTPVGIMLAAVGNLNDGEKYRDELLDSDESAMKALYVTTLRAMQFTKDMTALKGAADFLSVLDSKNPTQIGSWVDRVGSGSIKGYTPWSALITQTLKDYESLTDQPKKQGRSFSQMLYQDIPVARDGVNNALDALGDPLPIDTDRLFSAPPHRDAQTQRIWNWMNKNDLFITVPSRNSGGAQLLRLHKGQDGPMSDDEYYAFMKKRGELLKSAIQMNIDRLEKMPTPKAKDWLKKHAAKANKLAKTAVFGPNAVPIGERNNNGANDD
jgi:hypothetical protein